MIRIALCDDDVNFLVFAAEKIRKQFAERLEQIRAKDVTLDIRVFQTGDTFLEEHIEHPFDIVFLDVDLPGESGFSVSVEFRANNPYGVLIFVSNYYNYVYDMFKYNPIFFMRKGFFDDDIAEVTKMALKTFRTMTEVYTFEYKKQLYSFPRRSIVSISAGHTKNSIIIKTRDGKQYKQHTTLAAIGSTEFWKSPFVKVNRSCIVNLFHVWKIDQDEIVLFDLDRIPISEAHKEELTLKWIKFSKSANVAQMK